jgi:hypothetical protein
MKRAIGRGMAILAVLAGMGMLWAWRHDRSVAKAERRSTYRLNAQEVAALQPGDIILRRGYGLVSDLIVGMLREERSLSHCGIVADRDGERWVAHSVSSSVSEADGMQAHRLQEFVRQSRPGSVVVTRLCADAGRERIAQRAWYHLDRRVPFDHGFDLADSSSFYCSELLWRILKDDLGVDVHPEAGTAGVAPMGFAAFLDPEHFEVVLDHHR